MVNTLALVLAEKVVNKLSDSLAVVKFKKHGYTGSYAKDEAVAETVQERQKRRWRHLVRHLERWRLRYLQTHTVKN